MEDLKSQIAQINRQKDKLLDLSLKNLISDSEFKSRNDKFNQEICIIQQRIDSFKNNTHEIDKFKKKLEELKSALSDKIDIQNQLPFLMILLVERIEVEKINNDRKHIRLIIHFNFDSDIVDKELDLYEKNNPTKKRNS